MIYLFWGNCCPFVTVPKPTTPFAGTWKGALEQFLDILGGQIPALLSRDGNYMQLPHRRIQKATAPSRVQLIYSWYTTGYFFHFDSSCTFIFSRNETEPDSSRPFKASKTSQGTKTPGNIKSAPFSTNLDLKLLRSAKTALCLCYGHIWHRMASCGHISWRHWWVNRQLLHHVPRLKHRSETNMLQVHQIPQCNHTKVQGRHGYCHKVNRVG